MSKQPEAFKLGVPAADLVDLRERLAHTRWPDQAPGPAWAYGTDLGWMRELVEYWRDSFDWRAQEERLNAFPQYKVKLNGIDLHFLHVRGEGLNPCPLLLSHGWPGFSRGQPRFGVEAIADCFAALMTDVLGYNRFGAQGGDWGSFITSRLAYAYRDRLIGIHLNLMPLRRDPKMVDDPTSDEQKYLGELAAWLKEETGYQWIQGTRPQTLAFALADSPVGLAAWIIEKFRAWSDCGGDLESVFTKGALLANISLYWFTGAIGSSFWPYYARMHGPWPVPDGATILVPTGYCEFPHEILRPPRSLAARVFTDIRRWSVLPRSVILQQWSSPNHWRGNCASFSGRFAPFRLQINRVPDPGSETGVAAGGLVRREERPRLCSRLNCLSRASRSPSPRFRST